MSRPSDEDQLALIRRALAGLRFGEIVIAVHDGEIVQIARTEKIRPQSARRTPADSTTRGPVLDPDGLPDNR